MIRKLERKDKENWLNCIMVMQNFYKVPMNNEDFKHFMGMDS